MISLRGLATGIGSLPYTDPDQAVDVVLKYLPQAPFWPQLPKIGLREGMIAQFSQNLPCLKITPDGLYFDPKHEEQELESFYEQVIAHNLDYFRIGPDYAAGLYEFHEKLAKIDLSNIEFIKCHVTGPLTFAAGLKDEKGLALLHDKVFMQVIVKGLVMKALWQIKHFSAFGKKIIIFIDEPYLSGLGSAFTPLNREDAARTLVEFAEAIKSENTLIGVHCCGNTDWSVLTENKYIDIINFDAFGYLEKFIIHAHDLKKFMQRGGIICWGIVPTQEFTGRETAELLVKKIDSGISVLAGKGVDEKLLKNNLLVSPSCGLGSLESEKPERILQLLAAVSANLSHPVGGKG